MWALLTTHANPHYRKSGACVKSNSVCYATSSSSCSAVSCLEHNYANMAHKTQGRKRERRETGWWYQEKREERKQGWMKAKDVRNERESERERTNSWPVRFHLLVNPLPVYPSLILWGDRMAQASLLRDQCQTSLRAVRESNRRFGLVRISLSVHGKEGHVQTFRMEWQLRNLGNN